MAKTSRTHRKKNKTTCSSSLYQWSVAHCAAFDAGHTPRYEKRALCRISCLSRISKLYHLQGSNNFPTSEWLFLCSQYSRSGANFTLILPLLPHPETSWSQRQESEVPQTMGMMRMWIHHKADIYIYTCIWTCFLLFRLSILVMSLVRTIDAFFNCFSPTDPAIVVNSNQLRVAKQYKYPGSLP